MKSSSNITLLAISVAAPLLMAACSQQPVKTETSPINPVTIIEQPNPQPFDSTIAVTDIAPEPENEETTATDITLDYQLTEEEQKLQASRPAQHLFLFEFDKHSLTDDALSQVQAHGEFLAQHPNLTLVIKGHADRQGDPVYNERLALARAQNVANVLIEAGANLKQIQVESFGSSEPLAGANHYRDNRRVELVYEDEYYVRNGEEF